MTNDFSLVSAQIRAARGLLGWSQAYLAEGVGVSRATIVGLETGKTEPHPATLFVIESELAAAGINFTDKGVEFRNVPPRPYVPTGIKQQMPVPVAAKRPERPAKDRPTLKNLKRT
jgi:transcriptional regulator with XRE-family HTH domain